MAHSHLMVSMVQSHYTNKGIKDNKLFSVNIVDESWLYLTNYVNRYGEWKWCEYVLTSINMIVTLYMSNTISSLLDMIVKKDENL
ncbi:MAG: hypothetical protein U0L02_05585 [Kandleria vitulina]|uniref:hypothetical protein n=1 Tax=Kandleria vitulina TaxID=1630 RepID=UPI002E78065A|nr:hypothetical protein [Kandleria vitulina]MEE0988811.1 hypothetical protein [Kandleria vitulina]